MESYEHPIPTQEQTGHLPLQPRLGNTEKLRIQQALIFDDPLPERHAGNKTDDRIAMHWIKHGGAKTFGNFWAQHGGDPEIQEALQKWDNDPDASLRIVKDKWVKFKIEQRGKTTH